MNFDSFCHLAETSRPAGGRKLVVPLYRSISADLFTPVSAFLKLRQNTTFPFLLESVEGGENVARYSFLGRRPYLKIQADDKNIIIEENPNEKGEFQETEAFEGNIFTVLQSIVDDYEEVIIPGLPRLTAGAVGYIGYDTVRLIEDIPANNPQTVNVPDAIWCLYDSLVAFDHVTHQMILIANAILDDDTDLATAYSDAMNRLDELQVCLEDSPLIKPESVTLIGDKCISNTIESDFEKAVLKAQDYITAGDIFQVVLSQRFSQSFTGDSFQLYRTLRQVNPSPYLFYLDFDAVTLIGSSPETLVRVEAGKVSVMPIAGTRRRGNSPSEDENLATELLADPKERAEHLMLVDLGRNDLSRVCEAGTVEVEDYAFIERFSHVMHIVSQVSGALDKEKSLTDVLKATFPAGTLSGAPKIRAMEIIDELEPDQRKIYGGGVGYIDFSGNMDLCIAIRTMVVENNNIHIQAGAGIVADSVPAKEFQETINKADALFKALAKQ